MSNQFGDLSIFIGLSLAFLLLPTVGAADSYSLQGMAAGNSESLLSLENPSVKYALIIGIAFAAVVGFIFKTLIDIGGLDSLSRRKGRKREH